MLQRPGPIPYENLSVFDVEFNFSRFVRGGTVDDPDIPNLSAREALHTHTYIPAQQSETLHRVSGFEKPSTGTALLKHTYQHHNQLSAISMRFKTLLPVRGFYRADPKAVSL